MKKMMLFLGLFWYGSGLLWAQGVEEAERKAGVAESLFDFGDAVIDFISGEKWAIIPAVVYSPETSLGLGARAIRVFRFQNDSSTVLRPSTLPITFLYTLNNQTIFTTELDLWANENRDYLNARFELSNFPFRYFGIGNDPLLAEGEFYTTRFAYFHLNYERKIAKGVYLGPRYEFRIDDIRDREVGGVLESTQPLGFDGQRLSGLGIVSKYDTRDNIFQPTQGWNNSLSWMGFASFLGSNFTFSQYMLDLRKYLNVTHNQVLAVQSWWSFTTGEAPFQHISLIGGSDRMRGYFEGRYRDRHAMVHQLEYRLPVYRNFGMVFFGHAGQVAQSPEQFDWSRFRYGGGFGFRYKLNQDGLNIRLDIAFGDQRAFYFGLNEVI
jgi:outer membrane protein assembly factor BamA